jgi:hypothetical protein
MGFWLEFGEAYKNFISAKRLKTFTSKTSEIGEAFKFLFNLKSILNLNEKKDTLRQFAPLRRSRQSTTSLKIMVAPTIHTQSYDKNI